jgi:hypothetical protein
MSHLLTLKQRSWLSGFRGHIVNVVVQKQVFHPWKENEVDVLKLCEVADAQTINSLKLNGNCMYSLMMAVFWVVVLCRLV